MTKSLDIEFIIGKKGKKIKTKKEPLKNLLIGKKEKKNRTRKNSH